MIFPKFWDSFIRDTKCIIILLWMMIFPMFCDSFIHVTKPPKHICISLFFWLYLRERIRLPLYILHNSLIYMKQ